MGRRIWLAAGVMLAAVHGASAQNFDQMIVFGASGQDSGWFNGTTFPSGNGVLDGHLPTAIAQGAGRITTSPGLMAVETLAQYLGLDAKPASWAGGANFAVQSASVTGVGGLPNVVHIPQQISNYIAAAGGANPNGLYYLSGGGSDIGAGVAPDVVAATFVNAIVGLRNAGARYIMVQNGPVSTAPAPQQAARAQYNALLWQRLADAGVKFIPVDANSVLDAVMANPTPFGITNVSPGSPACTAVAGVVGYASLCATTISPLVAPGADQTFLFADDLLHLTSAGQQILADYAFNLLVAPSQISFLAEAPLKTRAALISAIQNQLELSKQQKGPSGFTTWVSGDVSRLEMDNRDGFPDDPGTPAALTAGFDFKTGSGSIFGVALSAGTTKQSYSTGGHFRQNEFAGSVYLAGNNGGFWYDLIGSVGYLDYDVNRTMPVGLSVQPNRGSTEGWNASGSARAGINFGQDAFAHGPFAGVLAQRVQVDGFTESGSFTSLAFGSQTRNSLVGSIGYQWAVQAGAWRPFLQLSWNHDFASTDRLVTASLTTAVAPSYALPAVELGKHWGAATLGVRFDLAANMKGYAAVTGQIGQDDATAYGGQIGVSAAF